MRRTGKYAYVNGISCVTSWQVSKNANVGRYSASCSPDGSSTVEGNIDYTGQMTGIGYLPPLPSSDDLAFIGVASAQNGEIVNYEGDILVTDTTLNIPVGTSGGQINWQSTFGVQGILTPTTTPAYFDDTREGGPAAKYGKVSIESVLDSNSFTDVDNIQNIVLTFKRPAVTSVNAGVTYREAGNLEVDISFEVHNDDMEVAAYALNQINRVRVYVTNALFYMFDSIQWGQLGPFTVQRNPPTMIGYTVNGMWTALRDRTPAALGEILLPGGGQLYGEVVS